MKDKILVDTNILVYAYDNSEAIKQAKSISILDELLTKKRGVITNQVLAEFFVTVTRKITQPLTITEAIKSLENHQKSWLILEITPMIILEAARGVKDYQINFWDAQIWATAKLNQIPIIYSEDFQVDSFLEGVNFVNPLLNND